jgi:hypothetical protein
MAARRKAKHSAPIVEPFRPRFDMNDVCTCSHAQGNHEWREGMTPRCMVDPCECQEFDAVPIAAAHASAPVLANSGRPWEHGTEICGDSRCGHPAAEHLAEPGYECMAGDAKTVCPCDEFVPMASAPAPVPASAPTEAEPDLPPVSGPVAFPGAALGDVRLGPAFTREVSGEADPEVRRELLEELYDVSKREADLLEQNDRIRKQLKETEKLLELDRLAVVAKLTNADRVPVVCGTIWNPAEPSVARVIVLEEGSPRFGEVLEERAATDGERQMVLPFIGAPEDVRPAAEPAPESLTEPEAIDAQERARAVALPATVDDLAKPTTQAFPDSENAVVLLDFADLGDVATGEVPTGSYSCDACNWVGTEPKLDSDSDPLCPECGALLAPPVGVTADAGSIADVCDDCSHGASYHSLGECSAPGCNCPEFWVA